MDCSRGCGAKVTFGRRGANRNISRTEELVAKLTKVHDAFAAFVSAADRKLVADSGNDPGDLLRRLEEEANAGTWHREVWITLVHGEESHRDPDLIRWEVQDAKKWLKTALALWAMGERRRRRDGW